VLILVSKFDHCLNDLLYRWRIGELKMEVTAIVSNHPDLKPIADAHGLPYHHSNSHFGEFTRFRVAGEPARSCAA
jgi:formyltetrahydrofolate hydrolase